MKKYIFPLLVLLCAVPVLAQDYNTYLQSAQNNFNLGDYENAQKALMIYVKMTGQSETNLSVKITTAIELLKTAQISTDNQKYAHAITLYKQVLSINPKDPNISIKIKNIEDRIETHNKRNRIGDYYDLGGGLKGRIAYLDDTGKHGFIITKKSNSPKQRKHTYMGLDKNERVPSIKELQTIYNNRNKLGLFETYWSSTMEWHDGLWYSYNIGFCLDFNSGKIIKTKLPEDEKFYYIIIADF